MTTLMEWVSLAGVLTSVATAAYAVRKTGAEARKLDGDNATQIGRTGIEMATADRAQLEKNRIHLDKMQTQLDELRARETAREHLLIRHASWDHRMLDRVRAALPEFQIEDPPPLWLNSQTAG